MNKKIGIIADTNMGKKYFENNGYVVITRPGRKLLQNVLNFSKKNFQ